MNVLDFLGACVGYLVAHSWLDLDGPHQIWSVWMCHVWTPFPRYAMWCYVIDFWIFRHLNNKRPFRKFILHIWKYFYVYQSFIRVLGHLKCKKVLNRPTIQLVTT